MKNAISSINKRLFTALISLVWISLNATAEGEWKNCQSCHLQQFKQWQSSDHAHSMAIATTHSVLGNFNDAHTTHFSLEARFTHDEDGYWVTVSQNGEAKKYQVEYTFGFEPLQQYLAETDTGRYQVLPFAWDNRPEESGGQRWFHQYDEDIAPNDRLHWSQPLQNWNGMCADCHSDGIKRQIDTVDNTFDTRFDQINVGCLSCHDGKQNIHTPALPEPKQGGWVRTENQAIAQWQGPKRDTRYEQTCYACHALRAPLTDGFDSNTPFLDQFAPQWLTQPFYHADGQIHDEVFVFGSFQQSKMAQAGVTCIDCHDAHTGKIRGDGNAVCAQCHAPNVFDVPKHHGHDNESIGAACINCHMPKSLFMGIDARGDHSFKIPRPEFTIQYGTPNACNTCHKDNSAQWALDAINKLHPERLGPSLSEGRVVYTNSVPTRQGLIDVAKDQSLLAIVRASAIAKLQNIGGLSGRWLTDFVASPEPLIRLAVAQVGDVLSVEDKRQFLPMLLEDETRAVRVAAAYSLLGVELAPHSQKAFETAFQEMLVAHEVNSWRGDGLLQQANAAIRNRDIESAMLAYETSITIDPYFAPAYVNLADIYRRVGNVTAESETLALGIKNNPKDGALHYSYALHFVRNKQVPNTLKYVANALKLEPENAQYAYLYLLALENLGLKDKALAEIDALIKQVNDSRQLQALKSKWLKQG